MDFFETVVKRRSVRKFSPEPVEPADLEKMVDAARLAPSGCNRQKWKFVVLTRSTDIAWFQTCPQMGWVAQAPSLILITLDPSTEYWREDGSAAIENLMLAAAALGYGTCWVQGQTMPYENQVKERFGVPENWRILAVIPVGKPAKWPDTPPKKSLSDVMSLDRF